MPSYFYEVLLFQYCKRIIAYLNCFEPVYALYSKNVKVHILSLPVILQFIIGSIQMEQVTRSHQFNSYCDKPSSLKNAGLAGCVFWYPLRFCFSDRFSLRGSVLLAHVAIWVAIFANRNVAQGVVVRLVVRESAWVLFILISQWSTSTFCVYILFTTAIITCFAGIITSQTAYAVVSDSSNPFVFFVWESFMRQIAGDTDVKLDTNICHCSWPIAIMSVIVWSFSSSCPIFLIYLPNRLVE